MRMAFDFKERFDRSGISLLSGTIEIDRSIFLESAISTAVINDHVDPASPLELSGPVRYMTIYMVRSVAWTRSIWRTPRRI